MDWLTFIASLVGHLAWPVAVFLVALALVGAAFYLILDRIYVNQLKSQAETVADNVDAFGSWVAQYGRVWVKDDNKSYLGHASLLQPEEGTPDGTVPPAGTKLTPIEFYSKNPALAQREFSEAVERSPSLERPSVPSRGFGTNGTFFGYSCSHCEPGVRR